MFATFGFCFFFLCRFENIFLNDEKKYIKNAIFLGAHKLIKNNAVRRIKSQRFS